MVYVEIVPRFTSIFSSQEFNVIEIWRCIQVITIITRTEIGPQCIAALLLTEVKIFRTFINIWKQKKTLLKLLIPHPKQIHKQTV